MYLKPAKDLLVRDPSTGEPLPAAGADKPDTAYWRRRLRDGDAVTAKRPKAGPSRRGQPQPKVQETE